MESTKVELARTEQEFLQRLLLDVQRRLGQSGDDETVAVRTLAQEVAEREDLVSVLLPVGDGLLVARKVWSPDAE